MNYYAARVQQTPAEKANNTTTAERILLLLLLLLPFVVVFGGTGRGSRSYERRAHTKSRRGVTGTIVDRDPGTGSQRIRRRWPPARSATTTLGVALSGRPDTPRCRTNFLFFYYYYLIIFPIYLSPNEVTFTPKTRVVLAR